MSNDIVFLNQIWIWPVVLGSIVLLAVFIWKEWHGISKNRRIAKIIIGMTALVSLAMIALKPAFERSIEKGRAVLLTPGYQEDRLDSLIATYKELNVIRYGPGKSVQNKLDSVHSLYIIGNGPAPFDFVQFAGIQTTYLEGDAPDGITRLKYKSENSLGNAIQVKGRYDNPKRGNFLVLQDPSGNGLDSVVLKSAESQNFSLSTALKVKGYFTYSLTEKDSLGSIRNSEPLPLSVNDKKSLKVLIINSYPTFESKYLKNYLAEMNHKVMVRSQLTKGKYKFEYFNSERTPLYGFSTENLTKFDILIIDALSFKNLSLRSRTALIDSARVNGLGIFIQSDGSFFQLPNSKSHFDFKRIKETEVTLEQLPKTKIEKFPYQFEKSLLVQPIHVSKGSIVAAYKRLGKGRIGTTVLQNTYQLVLDGQTKAYQQLWAKIISATSNRNESKTEWQTDQPFVVVDQPFEFNVRTTLDLPSVVNGYGSVIPLRQDIDLTQHWRGTIYPRTTGWNQLRIEGDSASTYHFYVGDSTDWAPLRANNTITASKIYFDKDVSKIRERLTLIPIHPLWFFLIFLTCMGWLWMEPRLFGL